MPAQVGSPPASARHDAVVPRLRHVRPHSEAVPAHWHVGKSLGPNVVVDDDPAGRDRPRRPPSHVPHGVLRRRLLHRAPPFASTFSHPRSTPSSRPSSTGLTCVLLTALLRASTTQ